MYAQAFRHLPFKSTDLVNLKLAKMVAKLGKKETTSGALTGSRDPAERHPANTETSEGVVVTGARSTEIRQLCEDLTSRWTKLADAEERGTWPACCARECALERLPGS